jgi:hypothetical protein
LPIYPFNDFDARSPGTFSSSLMSRHCTVTALIYFPQGWGASFRRNQGLIFTGLGITEWIPVFVNDQVSKFIHVILLEKNDEADN